MSSLESRESSLASRESSLEEQESSSIQDYVEISILINRLTLEIGEFINSKINMNTKIKNETTMPFVINKDVILNYNSKYFITEQYVPYQTLNFVKRCGFHKQKTIYKLTHQKLDFTDISPIHNFYTKMPPVEQYIYTNKSKQPIELSTIKVSFTNNNMDDNIFTLKKYGFRVLFYIDNFIIVTYGLTKLGTLSGVNVLWGDIADVDEIYIKINDIYVKFEKELLLNETEILTL